MNYLDKLIVDYENVNDLVIKNLKNINIIFLETLVDQNKINDYILKILPNNSIPKNIKKLIPSPNIKDINNYNDLLLFLNNGFTIIINDKQIIAVETRANLNRSIDIPKTETTLFGPKEALVENYQTNLGLIKRRLKTNHLKNEILNIGRYTKTLVSILYIDDITDLNLFSIIKEKLKKIDVDGLNDVGDLKPYLNDEGENFFPAFKITERPDVITRSLLNGKIVILLDNSPFALILPSFLVDFINPISDEYSKKININFVKLLRFFCFFLSIAIPAFYIAITTYNQETVPTSLLISFQNQRLSVPFPSIVECLVTLLTCEILRESDLRFPSNFGSAISILGALILGEAAVSAGIVSPIMIIVASITFLSSMIFTDLEIINGIRYWRIFFLFSSSLFGLYGFLLSIIIFLINLCDYEIYGKPYFYPLMPFDLTYLKSTLISMKNKKRSKYLTKNVIKES